jgi:hypothetical protein
MRAFKVTFVASLLALGLALAMKAQADDKANEGAMRVVLRHVKVAETKADGSSWDVNGGKPDIIVTMKNLTDTAQKAVVTDEKTDTFEAAYESGMVLVAEGQRLQIQVDDKDVAGNDLIGKTEFDVTADMLKKGKLTISFAQVKELTMEFRKP